jgi:class 3 adenylate cyclase
MTALPGGTVAILMTDVVSSSPHWNADPVAMDRSVGMLDELVHRAAHERCGVVIKARGEGDSHFAVFARASDAVLAGCDIQLGAPDPSWPVPLEVRAAVHAGELEPRNGDYLGPCVNHAARLRLAAHGGQIVVSSVAADLAAPNLAGRASLRTLGSHRLRDWGMQEVFQAHVPGLRTDFPPLSLSADQARIMAVVHLDVVDSTRLAATLEHQDLLVWFQGLGAAIRRSFDDCEGRFLKLMGDGGVALFEDPVRAIEFARRSRALAPRLRCGVHVGSIDLIDGDIVGHALFAVAQIAREAAAGEILVSRMVADLVANFATDLVRKPGEQELYIVNA